MELLGAVGYAAVALLYAGLTVLLAFAWRGTTVGALLIAACVASSLWAGLLAVNAWLEELPRTLLFVTELLRTGAWVLLVSWLLGRLGAVRWLLGAINAGWVLLILTGAGLWAWKQFVPGPLNLGSLLIPGGLVVSLAGLILIEQLVRNWSAAGRWDIKPLALGVGGMFAYDLFMYAQGVLFGVVEESLWSARGVVNVLFVPLVAIAARRNQAWELDIFVSRHVVFYSTTLVAVGLYLILMSAGGYLILLYGGTWGALAQIVFFVGALLILALLLFSASLRARFKVFLSKHFFRNKYDYREEWLRLIQTLSGFRDSSTRETVIQALAQIVGSPAGVLWVKDERDSAYRVIAEYQHPVPVPDVPESEDLIDFIRNLGWLVDLREYRDTPERYGGLALPGWLREHDKAWLLVPLLRRQELLGLVLLERAPVPFDLNYEDRDLLKTVGHHIAVQIAQERSDNLLAEAQQFQAYNRLTAFLMHDLNNLIAQQSLILKNADRHKANPEFIDDALQTIASSVERMKKVMEQLRTGEAHSGRKKTLLKFLVSTAVDRCAGRQPVPQFVDRSGDAGVEIDGERFTMVLTHLIRNAQDATPGDGEVEVAIDREGTACRVSVRDTGSGMSTEFVRDRLFRPFDSTKGSQGMGIGAYQAREFARGMGGDLKVESAPGAGTTMTMTLPLGP